MAASTLWRVEYVDAESVPADEPPRRRGAPPGVSLDRRASCSCRSRGRYRRGVRFSGARCYLQLGRYVSTFGPFGLPLLWRNSRAPEAQLDRLYAAMLVARLDIRNRRFPQTPPGFGRKTTHYLRSPPSHFRMGSGRFI